MDTVSVSKVRKHRFVQRTYVKKRLRELQRDAISLTLGNKNVCETDAETVVAAVDVIVAVSDVVLDANAVVVGDSRVY